MLARWPQMPWFACLVHAVRHCVVQDPAVAEQYSGQGAAVAPGVPLCSAPPACRSASLLHDVPAHHTALAFVDLVAHAALQAQQVSPSTGLCCTSL